MIDGFVRSIKEIESNSDMLTERFGEWSWSKSAPYVCVKQALKNYSFQNIRRSCVGVSEFIYYLRSIPVCLEIAIWLQTFFLWNSRLSILGTVECLIGQFCRIRFEFKITPINSLIEMMQFQRIHRLK